MVRINDLSELQISDDIRRMNPELDAPVKRPRKYHNVRTQANGMTFDSGREAVRMSELMLLEEHQQIFGLRFQVPFELPGGVRYVADAVYIEFVDGKLTAVVEDCKGARTKEYKIKKKLFREKFGAEIRET
jgi:hypothetical protein